MKHLGDITKISGYDAPVVDCVIGGSPCQDLSVAGKRAGLAGERSGLYMEQIRIIREMREADAARGRTDEFIRPRYMVWENVPGAFSSNGGKDFAAVIEEAIRVAEPKAPPVPVPEKGWPTSGCFFDVDGRWSVAWRVFDAQFWGVPQRRRRIALVADFGGLSAPEILFVRKGVSGHSEPGRAQREGTSGAVEGGAGGAEPVVYNGENITSPLNKTDVKPGDPCHTLGTDTRNYLVAVEEEMGPTLLEGRSDAAVYDARGNGNGLIAPAMTGDHFGHSNDYMAICIGNGQANQVCGEVTGALNCMHDQQAVCVGIDCRNFNESPVYQTLQAKSNGGQPLNYSHAVRLQHIVRRLTPLECERLQGFPDGWTDIGEWVDSKGKKRKGADSPRYKALGNSIALPNWVWILKRISAVYERDATMASLFDGIGGFPLIWERINGKGSCLWASEIEEFPMAVTKRRFGN